MKQRKFKIAIGACGPTIMYSHIIIAENERDAVIKYLKQDGTEATEESIRMYLDHVNEILPLEAPDKLLDFDGNEIALGDSVVFVKNYGVVDGKSVAPKLLSGKVVKIGAKGIVIEDGNGEESRLNLSKKNSDRLVKVAVMKRRPERDTEDLNDATGYPLREGDVIAYMGKIYMSSCESLVKGTVKSISAKTVFVDDTKKAPERTVVLKCVRSRGKIIHI